MYTSALVSGIGLAVLVHTGAVRSLVLLRQRVELVGLILVVDIGHGSQKRRETKTPHRFHVS